MKKKQLQYSRHVFIVLLAILSANVLAACSSDKTEYTEVVETSAITTETASEEEKETKLEENTEPSVPIVSSNIKYIIVDRAAVYEAGSEELLSDSAIIDYLDKGIEVEVIQKVSDLYTKVYYSDGVGYLLNSDFGKYSDLVASYKNDSINDTVCIEDEELETESIETEDNKTAESDEENQSIETWIQDVDTVCLDDYVGTYQYYRDNTLPTITIYIKPVNDEVVSVFYSYIDPFKGEESIEGNATKGCFLNNTLIMRFTEQLGNREYEAGLTISFDDGSFAYAIIKDTYPGVGTFPTHSVTGVLEKQ